MMLETCIWIHQSHNYPCNTIMQVKLSLFIGNWSFQHAAYHPSLTCECWFWAQQQGISAKFLNNRKRKHSTQIHIYSTKEWKYPPRASCILQCACNPLRIACGGGTTSEAGWDDTVYPHFLTCLIAKDIVRWKLLMLEWMVVFDSSEMWRREKRGWILIS